MDERWLTLRELCTELRLPRRTVVKLITQGKVYGMGGSAATKSGRKMYDKSWRFLSPTPRYRDMLGAQERLLKQQYRIDLLEAPLLCTADLAALTGLGNDTLRGLRMQGKIVPSVTIGKYNYYSVEEVRRFLLKRERKEPTDRRARCETILRWCLAQLEENQVETMTVAEVRNDDKLEGHLQKLLRQKEPLRSRSLREFWRRYTVCRDVAAVLRKSSNR